MGSDALILDEGLAAEASGWRSTIRRCGSSTGRTRPVTRTPGGSRRCAARSIPRAHPRSSQDDPDVMFQRIRYDGLVGDAFLRRFAVTFDVAGRGASCSPDGRLGRRHGAERGGRGRRAPPADRCVARRPRVGGDLRRRRLDRRHLCAAPARCTTPTRACASCASSATSASTRRCTPASRARAGRGS